MNEYYKAIIAKIENANLTGSCSYEGLIIAKESFEKLVLKGAKNIEQDENNYKPLREGKTKGDQKAYTPSKKPLRPPMGTN